MSKGRQAVAVYPLASTSGPAGEVRLWSRGVYHSKGKTIAHVAVELESNSTEPIEIDVEQLRLSTRLGEDPAVRRLAPARTAGAAGVAARGYGRLDAYFELEEVDRPMAVTSFDVRWAATAGNERTGDTTPFVRTTRPSTGASFYHGPYIPGTRAYSPYGGWFSCPGSEIYYPYPPNCDEE